MRDSASRSGLDVDQLTVTNRDSRVLVDSVSFSIREGETVALVGESGSGKSLTAKAIAGLLPRGLTASGRVVWGGDDLLAASHAKLRSVRGREISLLLQDPFTMLNPLSRISTTLRESADPEEYEATSVTISDRITEVGIQPHRVLTKYPWELSGGMRQRIGLAASISRFPNLLIADEPTTALDATTQREVLRLVGTLQASRAMALILITHDLRIAMSLADRVVVMSEGRIVEEGTPSDLFADAKDPCTRKLLAAQLPVDRRLDSLAFGRPESSREPEADKAPLRDARIPLVSVSQLSKQFGKDELALSDVTFEIFENRTLGIIGESGSGKTTLARCLLDLEKPSAGAIRLEAGGGSDPILQREIQCVFQDPYSSLNPSHTVGFTLMESIRHREKLSNSLDPRSEVVSALEQVGLDPDVAVRRPVSLSGGQRQRIAIARALLMKPRLLVCDEPVAALDLSVQSQVLEVLRDAQRRGLTMAFITHDLAVARQMADDVIVLNNGKIVERGPTARVLDSPEHEYTRHLLGSVPTADRAWLDSHE